MSLFVILKSRRASTGKQNEMELHIPFNDSMPTLVIDFIQADCDELDAIWERFHESIPMPVKNKVVRWYGDIAKTIYFNLR
jgi:hypothetical protein